MMHVVELLAVVPGLIASHAYLYLHAFPNLNFILAAVKNPTDFFQGTFLYQLDTLLLSAVNIQPTQLLQPLAILKEPLVSPVGTIHRGPCSMVGTKSPSCSPMCTTQMMR
jgi:hypothetical protein